MGGELAGKVAVVTGAGQGIGKALARGLAAAGAAVVVADVVSENAATTARQIIADGGRALGLRVDVSQRAQVQAMIDGAISELNRVDILINNAGVFPRATVLELDEETWSAVINVNLKGTWLCSQAAACRTEPVLRGRPVPLPAMTRRNSRLATLTCGIRIRLIARVSSPFSVM